jgi:hypothetical protein
MDAGNHERIQALDLRERPMTSDRQLRRWYNAFNRQWFGDRLPKDTVLRYEVVNGAQAECIENLDGRYLIRLNPAIAWAQRNAKMALMHEMAHVAIGNEHGHGKKFQEEMLRLAQCGALKNLW